MPSRRSRLPHPSRNRARGTRKAWRASHCQPLSTVVDSAGRTIDRFGSLTMPKERQQRAPKEGRVVLAKSKSPKSKLQSGSKRTCSDISEVSSTASESDDSDEGQEMCEPIRTHRPKTHSERQKDQRPVRLGFSVVKTEEAPA